MSSPLAALAGRGGPRGGPTSSPATASRRRSRGRVRYRADAGPFESNAKSTDGFKCLCALYPAITVTGTSPEPGEDGADPAAGLLEAGIDTAPESIAVLDEEGRILVVNETWRRFAAENGGDHLADWEGQNYLSVCERSESPTAAAAADGLRGLLAGSETEFRLEYPCHAPDERRWFLLRAARFTHTGDVYVWLSHADVTERKLAELEANGRASQLETILGVLTHDIRNPINVIDGYAELLEREVDDPGAVESIREATDRITEITETTLRFVRSGGLSEVEPVDVSELAREAWATVPTAAATLETSGSRTVHGDRQLLRQLLENLYRNAVEHAGEECTVTVGSLPDGFYVADDGPGLPAEVRERVTDADFGTRGVGLGLSIVRAVADAHGATLRVTDGPSGGARFEFRDLDLAP